MSIVSAMQYPHWLMIAGAIFVMLGFIGFAFRNNKNVVEPDHGATEMKAKGKWSEGLAQIDSEYLTRRTRSRAYPQNARL